LVFADVSSRELLAYLERVGPSNATVLIHGDTGTGKELVARHLHALHPTRSQKPFIAVNCAALSEGLLEAELFGHRKGAFTGADSNREGWFEAANGGTLFLDEIGDLPLAAQAKLLCVLQEREVVKGGERRATPLDIRMIAATNIDLKAAVEAGRFRTDLYYRLHVAEVRLLPLRERRGDIPLLVEHFLRLYGKRLGYTHLTLEPQAMSRLLNYSWPGNIRELENVIHHTLLICKDNRIRAEDIDLPARPQTFVEEEQDPMQLLQKAIELLLAAKTPDLCTSVERTLIETVYQACATNQVKTAAMLGISRHVLRERLQRLGLIARSPSRLRT
jgi:sigma-54-specific transcriptional regulator